MISRDGALCWEIVASLILVVVARLAWLAGGGPQMRKLVMHICTLTWWEILRRIRRSRHSIGRLSIGWSIKRDVNVRLYRLLASLGLIWPPGSALLGAIASIMDGL